MAPSQLEVDHAVAGVELRVVQRVLDPQRLARLQHLLHDRVRETLHRVRHVLALEVPRLEDPRRAFGHLQHEPLVCAHHLDQRVQKARERAVDPRLVRQLPGKLRQPRGGERLRRGRRCRATDGRGWGGPLPALEDELRVAELDGVSVRQDLLTAPLAVDHQLCALERRGHERLAVELDGHHPAQIGNADVAVRGRRERGERFHQRHERRRRALRMHHQSRHQRPCPCPCPGTISRSGSTSSGL